MAVLALVLSACKPAPTPPAPQGPIAAAIQKQLDGKLKLPLQRPMGAMDRALQELYAARDYRPLWNDPAALHGLMLGGFQALGSDGLRPQDYVIDNWFALSKRVYAPGVSADERAAFDLRVTRLYLRALSHVAFGKVDPASVGTEWDSAPAALSQRLALPWAMLAAQTGNIDSAIAQARPPYPQYRQLRAALLQYRDDPARVAQLRVNLERARWLLHDLPESYVLVDVAGYRLNYHRPNGEVWSSKVVVGKPYRETPAFRSAIDMLTFNPTWTVPPTIFSEDIAPKARRDAAGTLSKKHLRALDGQNREVPLERIDWNDPRSVILRQDPGPENPLGQVKIQFPNAYQVYLHDTPGKAVFDRDNRADSSGCIRVENVLQLAALLLQDSGTEGEVRQHLADGSTREVKLARSIPVMLHYGTVEIDADGRPQFRDDIYQRDPPLLAALDKP